MSTLLRIFIVCLLCLNTGMLLAQQANPPFYSEIQGFKKQDSITPPLKNPILFYGSSSLRMWSNLQEMFPGYPVINHGFGGSTFPDLIRYVDEAVIAYQPKQVVIYCGDNDIATDTVDSRMVTNRFKTLFQMIRKKLPGVPVVFISIKPSPSRVKYLPVIKQANQMINNFLYQQQNVGYVDVYSRMLDATGQPIQALFLEDNLHMNEKGYLIWQEALKPYLVR